MKKLLAIVLSLLMVLSMVACAAKEEPAAPAPAAPAAPAEKAEEAAPAEEAAEADPYADLEPVEIVGADNASVGAAAEILGKLIAEKVADITGGKLTVDYHPNGDLGNDADALRQAKDGDIGYVVCQTAQVVSFVPEMAVFDLPMVFAKYDGAKISNVLNGDNEFTQKLKAAHSAQGFEMLGFLQNATYRLTTSNTDLSTVEAFKGLQIRTMENANHMDFWKAIDAEPTPLAWSEVYFALQSGMLGAQENAADTCAGANLQEVQKYLSCTNHILYCNEVLISGAVWAELDPAYQAALQQATLEAIAEVEGSLVELDSSNKAKLAEGGMTITEYDAAFYDGILAVQGVQDLYAKIDADCGGLGTLLQAELAK